ncbi:MAG TPA: hypothetical protein V6C97_08085 [Oculatellaceae cyanobacterium]
MSEVSNYQLKRSFLLPTLPAFVTAAGTFTGSLLAAFIFACGMRYMDGAAGAQSEGLPMVALFSLVPLWLTATVWFDLSRTKPRYYYARAKWPVPLCAIGYFALAAVAGFAMKVVQWGDDFVHLNGIAFGALGAAAVVAVGLGLYYLMRGSETK